MPEDVTEDKKKDRRETKAYWAKWIQAAKKTAKKKHWSYAKRAWDEYEKEEKTVDLDDLDEDSGGYCYPAYFFACKTLEPAYYARTPKGVTKRRFGFSDTVAGTMSLITLRVDEALTEAVDFDAVILKCVQDFINADKAAPQISYEEEEEAIPVPLMFNPEMGVFVDPGGMPWEDAQAIEGSDEEGYIGTKIITKPKIRLSALPYDDYLHTPTAKTESEITEKAYFFCITKEKALKRFGKKKVNQINKWRKHTDHDEDRDNDDIEEENEEKYLEGWEIFCKNTKKVYWYSEQCENELLDVKDDPYGLKGFFPSPPCIISSPPRKHLYPKPRHSYLRTVIRELHNSQNKIFELIGAIERIAIASPELEDIIEELKSASTGDIFLAKNYANIVEKGGLRELIQFVPVQELVQAISELTTLQEKFDYQFGLWFGIPDILKGAGDPFETATQTEVTTMAAHDRFKTDKKLVQQLVRDTKEMMLDLCFATFPDKEIARMAGYAYMDPEDQQRFPEALAKLRNDDERVVRIDIETDSMNFVDERRKSHQANELAQTIMSGIANIAQASESDPGYAALGLKVLQGVVETLPGGKEFQDEIKQTVDGFIEKLNQPQEPPPDYQGMKLEIERNKLQLKQYEINVKAQLEQMKGQQKAVDEARKIGVKEYELALDNRQKEIDNMLEQFLAQLEAQRVQNEVLKTQAQVAESQMEEFRLAREADARLIEAYKPTPIEQPQMQPPQVINVQSPPINVTVEASKPGRRVGKVIEDPLTGEMRLEVETVIDEDVVAPQPALTPIDPLMGL